MNTQTLAKDTKRNPRQFNAMLAIFRDPVFITMLLLLGFLLFLDSAQWQTSVAGTLRSIWEMLPYFALAIGIAAYAKASGADALIARAFAGNPLRATVIAALVGAISPFCSCGVIPLIAALLGAGVPLAPVMAFWIASPIMDPEMFVITAAGIGLNFAIAKTLVAIAMGLFAGFSVLALQRSGFLAKPLKLVELNSCCGSSCGSNADPEVNWKFWKESQRVKLFKQEGGEIGIFLGKWLTLAFFLETLMVAYIPSGWIIDYVGADNFFAIPLATIVGIPSYLNGYAAVPLISGLLDIGMTQGAAMAFVTAGAVSSIPAAIAVYALVKKPVFLLYLSLGLVGAMATGWFYQLSSLGL